MRHLNAVLTTESGTPTRRWRGWIPCMSFSCPYGRVSMAIKACLLLLCGFLAPHSDAATDAWRDYLLSCKVPHEEHISEFVEQGDLNQDHDGWAASVSTCSTLVERLSTLTSPSPEERLALFKARSWLGHYADSAQERCDEVDVISEYLPNHAEVLVDLAHCTYVPRPRTASEKRSAKKRMVSLLRRSLIADPTNVATLEFLIEVVRRVGYDYGVDAAALAAHATALYEANGDVRAASYAFGASIDAGDLQGAEVIRDRVRSDVVVAQFDTTQYALGIKRLCTPALFDLDLEEACIEAVETAATTAASAGEPIPDDVLGNVEDAFAHLHHYTSKTGPKTGSAARLRKILEAYPEALRSSEHHRVYAGTTPLGNGRIEGLRRAVDVEFGNLAARCDLAVALTAAGRFHEAASVYKDLAAPTDEASPCDAAKMVRWLGNTALHQVPLHVLD